MCPLGIRFGQIRFQQIQQGVAAPLAVKVRGGDGSRIIGRGQIVDLLQPIYAVFLTGPDLGRIDADRLRR